MEFATSSPLILAAATAAAAKNNAVGTGNSSALPIGYFDIFLIIMLIIGFVRGRSRGMSGELVDLIQWICIVIGGAFLYEPIGKLFKQVTGFSLSTSYIITYLILAIVIKVLTLITKKYVGEKLVGSGVFGGFEYYLGMLAGTLRFVCLALFIMALLHSTEIDVKSIEDHVKSQKESFNNVMWPNYAMIQRSVFEQSITGKFMAKKGKLFLIARAQQESRGDSIARQREMQVKDAMGK